MIAGAQQIPTAHNAPEKSLWQQHRSTGLDALTCAVLLCAVLYCAVLDCVLRRRELYLPQTKERNALFDRLDYNGNGALSLAEIDKVNKSPPTAMRRNSAPSPLSFPVL